MPPGHLSAAERKRRWAVTTPLVLTIEVGEQRLRVRFDDGVLNVLEAPDGAGPWPPTPSASAEAVEIRIPASPSASFAIRAETWSP